MNETQDIACPCSGEGTKTNRLETNWTEAEARFQRAKQALRLAQEQHCEAAYDFLAARAEVRQKLEAVFPEQESGMKQAVLPV